MLMTESIGKKVGKENQQQQQKKIEIKDQVIRVRTKREEFVKQVDFFLAFS